MKKLLPFFFLSISASCLNAQNKVTVPTPEKKGTFYFSWGYNKDWFSKSDLHFSDPGSSDPADNGRNTSYHFTIYDAKAKDRPGFKDILRTDMTIPQYVYRVGYFNKNNLGVEINFDHTKYVMDDYQTLRVKGMIHGKYIDQDTMIDPVNFLHFEHTNGANFLMLNIMKKHQLLHTSNNRHKLDAVVKLGGGVVVPKTDVTLFGKRMDNCFHIAGYVAGTEVGLRYEAYKYIFLEYTAKGTFANYTKVLTIGTGRANHHFWTFENILALGLQFPL